MKKLIIIMIALFAVLSVNAQRVYNCSTYGYGVPGLVGRQFYVDGKTIVDMIDWHGRVLAYATLEGEWALEPGVPLRQAISRAQREKAREEYENRMWDAAVYGGDYYDRPVVRRAPRTTRGSSTTSRRTTRTTTTTDSSRFNAR